MSTVTISESKVLEFVETIEIPPQPKFIVCDNFVVDPSYEAKVKINHIGPHFDFWFGDKIEKPSPKIILDIHELKDREAYSEDIFFELGSNSVISLSTIFNLMKNQGNGQLGPLGLNEGNLFKANDRDGNPWWIVLCWIIDGWDVDGQHIERKYPWKKPERIFSISV